MDGIDLYVHCSSHSYFHLFPADSPLPTAADMRDDNSSLHSYSHLLKKDPELSPTGSVGKHEETGLWEFDADVAERKRWRSSPLQASFDKEKRKKKDGGRSDLERWNLQNTAA